jgi:uncharacterized protein (DUF488 family)
MMIHTIGHSTRASDELVGLLKAHGIAQLADVRSVPRSRRQPHFSIERLPAALALVDIVYRHFPQLGGMRKPRPDSTNIGWRHPGFRGYADYMAGEAFEAGLTELLTWGRDQPTAVMCAEAVWWRCHRQLIADALVARDVEVWHILTRAAPHRHELTEFARIAENLVTYPGLI